MQAKHLLLPLICLYMGMFAPKSSDQCKCSFECPGGSNAPNSVPNAPQTTQTGSLSLIDEQTSAPGFVFTCEIW